MKILHLIQKKQLRGAEMFASQLSNHQAQIGHEIGMIALFSSEEKLPFQGEIKTLNRLGKNRFLDFKGWEQLAGEIQEFQPDIVQANAGDTLKYAVFSKLIFKWKAPIISRNASTVSQYIKSTLVKLINSFLYKNTAHIISVSHASKADLNQFFPGTENKSTVIPIGIEITPQLQEAVIYDQNKLHIVHIGGFSFEKNHKGLLRIFKTVQESHPHIHLHLVGDGPLRLEINTLVQTMGLEDSVTFYGYKNNPLDYISAANVLVLPSLLEGLPGVILEAQYCKTPVVANNVGGISEIIQSDYTGWLIDKGNEDAFATAVIKVLKSTPEELKSITEAAHQQVVEQYDNKVIAKRFLEVYESVIAKWDKP